MSKRDITLLIVSIPVLGWMYWLLADALGGWVPILQLMGAMTLVFAIMAAVMTAFMGIIYLLTIFRSNMYADRLRAAGYAVNIKKDDVWIFALMGLITLIFTPIAAFLTYRITIINNWDASSFIIVGMMWLISLLGIYATSTMWWQSFRPLRKYYKAMRNELEVDLPRLHQY